MFKKIPLKLLAEHQTCRAQCENHCCTAILPAEGLATKCVVNFMNFCVFSICPITICRKPAEKLHLVYIRVLIVHVGLASSCLGERKYVINE